MEKHIAEELYWRLLEEITHTKNLKSSGESIMLMDKDHVWVWGVRLYAAGLRDYCGQCEREALQDAVAKTNKMASRHDQAKKILLRLGVKDEDEEGFWLKKFQHQLDKSSGKGNYTDRRSFTSNERPILPAGSNTPREGGGIYGTCAAIS